MTSLRGRWVAFRNALLMDREFQRFAARFPLTRGIARARARALFDIVAGFVYSQTIAACVRLDLFGRLHAEPQTTEDLARTLALSEPAFERLAKAAASLDLLERLPDGRWALGAQGAAALGNPGLSEMVAHHALLYADLADPVGFLKGERGGALSAFWPYARAQDGDAAGYSALMAASQPMIADQALEVLPLRDMRTLMDVGGGEGAFLIAAAKRAPHLKVVLFDLPEVAARAQARFAAAGLADRAVAHGGDFRTDTLPTGADAISLVRVLHDHDEPAVARLLASARRALPRGGRLCVIEPMSGLRGAEPAGDAYFGLYLYAMGSGRPRTFQEIAGLVRAAGFGRIREAATATPLLTRVLLARADSDPIIVRQN